ncbi:One cut domain family member [Caenorhabditis elegans]|uniref:One cut domain family member n=1 Tax=Caenorhabditis elegans TaxID=6239 RepID=A0A1X7RBR4_CAEEL|nr:One cut domain family member [Caenorhabditis elegans]SMQ11455.1 One cut domain family member [Caenorhabditis elegans]|eukprot:NP_001338819.1 One cut domain family member [Caenorhabditis elegans]
MESSRTAATSTNGTEKSRRRNTDYLQIDPSSTFINNTGRGFAEELPENFLDTISPHPITPSASTSSATSATEEPATSSAPQLASLAPMSMSSEQPSSSFSSASLLSSSYETIKNEPEDYRFSGSTAGLLSPLHVDSRRRESHDFNTSPYIKEEEDLDGSHLLMGGIRPDTPTNDRSTDLGSISSLLNEDHHTNTIGQSPSPRSTFGSDPTPMIQRQLIKNEDGVSPGSMGFSKNHQGYQKPRNGDRMEYEKAPYQRSLLNQALSSVISTPTISSSNIPTPPSAHIAQPRRIYSTQDSNDPLNAEIGDDIYIDTKDLCKRIAFELKNHSIPQAIFAERILCRSQGTLSDLLRNPKPWNKLKSGRETFRRMYNWVAQPLATRLAILDMKTEDVNRASGMSPPTPAQNVRTHRRSTSDHDGPVSKRPRLVFTDIQKRTLQAIFKETQRPSREMQQTIAEHLRLDLSTVANFFMNARRRSRLGGNIDEPTPFQQMAEMYKEGAIATSNHSAEQREMIERGFGVSIPGPSHSGELLNGDSHEDDEELDELNDSELAYEEDVEIGDEEEEDEEQANGDILPTPKVEELEEKTVIKEEAPDDGEYGATKLAAN